MIYTKQPMSSVERAKQMVERKREKELKRESMMEYMIDNPNLTYAEVAAKYEVSIATVFNVRKELGLPDREKKRQ